MSDYVSAKCKWAGPAHFRLKETLLLIGPTWVRPNFIEEACAAASLMEVANIIPSKWQSTPSIIFLSTAVLDAAVQHFY